MRSSQAFRRFRRNGKDSELEDTILPERQLSEEKLNRESEKFGNVARRKFLVQENFKEPFNRPLDGIVS